MVDLGPMISTTVLLIQNSLRVAGGDNMYTARGLTIGIQCAANL